LRLSHRPSQRHDNSDTVAVATVALRRHLYSLLAQILTLDCEL